MIVMPIIIVYKPHRSVDVFRAESPRVEVGVASASRVHAEGRVGVVACRRGDSSRHEVNHVLVSIVEEAGQAVFTQPHERTGRHGLRGVPDRLADVEVAIVDEPFRILCDTSATDVVGHRRHTSVRVARPADGAVLALVGLPSAQVVGVGLIGIDRGCLAAESEMKDFAQSLYSINKHFLPVAAVPAPNATLAYKTR